MLLAEVMGVHRIRYTVSTFRSWLQGPEHFWLLTLTDRAARTLHGPKSWDCVQHMEDSNSPLVSH